MILPYCPVSMGHDEEIDKFNFFLFSGHDLDWSEKIKVSGRTVQVTTKDLYYGTRLFRSVRFVAPIPFLLPFYRSTGSDTPDLSPEGTFWPCSGIWPEEASATGSRWIGKHFWSLSRGTWVAHYKELGRIPETLRDVCSWLQGGGQ